MICHECGERDEQGFYVEAPAEAVLVDGPIRGGGILCLPCALGLGWLKEGDTIHAAAYWRCLECGAYAAHRYDCASKSPSECAGAHPIAW